MTGVVDDVTELQGSVLDYRLELVRWETHAAPAAGRPQQVINDIIGKYDIFVGIMWRRFGTPTGVADSGTEEEFNLAYAAWEQDQRRPLLFYFCQKPFMPRTLDELEQMKQVLNFKKKLEGKALFWEYNEPEKFADTIRKHLGMRVKGLVESLGKPQGTLAQPKENEIRELHELWTDMDPELQRAFSIAYNENRRSGDGGIKTQDLFAALVKVGPKGLQPILKEIPAAALPKPIEGPVTDRHYILQEKPWLSHCVSASIHRLKKQLPGGRKLGAADIFADIAKHGTGESVRLLRQHEIGPNEIDAILKRQNIDVIGN